MLIRTIEDFSDMLVRYDYTVGLSREDWAWEFARRNPALREDAFTSVSLHKIRTACHDIKIMKLKERDRAAEAWGLLFFPDPDQPALATTVFWSDEVHPRKIAVHVRERDPGEIDEIFERSTRLCRIVHLVDASEREHILVKGKNCSVQVRCTGKSMLSLDPLKMEFSISGFSTFNDHVDTLSQAQCIYEHDNTVLPRWSRKSLGFRNALIALDAHDSGLNYQEMAMIFYDAARVTAHWSSPSCAMKSEMARYLARGQQLRDGGYRTLFEESLLP